MSATMHALVPAGGRGTRYGGAVPKQLQPVAGRPLLAWAVERLRIAGVERFVVALPAELVAEAAGYLDSTEGVRVVAGGPTRQESVRLCLEACEAASDELVAVHDAARPAPHPEDLARVFAAAAEHGAAVLGREVSDTLKRVEGGRIVATVERAGLFRAETPQVFRRSLLERAHRDAAVAGVQASDESGLVERLGVAVRAVAAAFPNPKVTWRGDERWIAALLLGSSPKGPECAS